MKKKNQSEEPRGLSTNTELSGCRPHGDYCCPVACPVNNKQSSFTLNLLGESLQLLLEPDTGVKHPPPREC